MVGVQYLHMLNLLIAKSSPLISPLAGQIKEAVAKSEFDICRFLHVDWDVDILFSGSTWNMKHLHGIGGETGDPYLVTMPINPSQVSKDEFGRELVSTIVHELMHCVQNKLTYGNYGNLAKSPTLDSLISEGQAVAAEKQFLRHESVTSALYDKPDVAKKVYQIVKPYLNTPIDNKDEYPFNRWWIVSGDDKYKLPNNAGYYLGYYLVKRYIEINNISAVETVLNKIPASEFMNEKIRKELDATSTTR